MSCQRSLRNFETCLRYGSLFLVAFSFILGLLIKDINLAIALILIASSYQLLRILFYIVGATTSWFASHKTRPQDSRVSSSQITILIPCFNEEDVIEKSLQHLKTLQEKNLQVIVIDDGSTDNTLNVAKLAAQKLDLDIQVLHQRNSGKAMALNLGLSQARGDFIFCADADSLIDPKALTYGLQALKDHPHAAAVAGSVRVLNPSNMTQIYQDIEYGIGDVQKSFLSLFGHVNIIPGPAGLFRKKALLDVGGYETSEPTFAEDTELTLRFLARGSPVLFEPKMFSSTQAPKEIRDLIRQRYRWSRGIYQAFRKNLFQLSKNKKKQFLVYLFLEKVWTPVIDFCLLVFLLGQFICSAKIDLFITYNLLLFSLEVVAMGISHALSKRFRWTDVGTLLVSRLSLSILITTWKFLCLQEEWGKAEMTWDKLDRENLVVTPEAV